MSLVWKLLRHHISIPQFVGFFFANLLGMLIVLLGFQFYHDVLPVFTQGDSFLGADYLIVSKRIGMGNTISGHSNTFSEDEIEEFAEQKFAHKVGRFTPTGYRAEAQMGVNGIKVLSSELFFESVPDDFIDVSLKDWIWQEGSDDVPVILPRTYINMYNFGFAQSHSLPKINDGLVGMIDFRIFIAGRGHQESYRGRVVGFSNRLNTILVPQSFMDWSNKNYAEGETTEPNRLIVEVANTVDENIAKFIEDNGYEVEDDNLNAEKTTYFLKMVVTIVMSVGIVISILSFYILMLSIYLLVQKNSSKLENLLLIGYSPQRVAMPYQILTTILNLLVQLIAWVAVYFLRGYYMEVLEVLFPDIDDGSILPTACVGLSLFALVTIINIFVIHNKVLNNIWSHKE